MGSKVVCVTGASGFIASWLVKLLLQRGYVVRATVRDLGNPEKTEHLRALEGAQERLQLYKANLLEEGSFDAAIDCCEGVFHMASPCYSSVIDPQVELIDPAVKGTLNVLNACAKASSVKRVVITSSVAAVLYNSRPRSPGVIDETWFSDPEYCKQTKSWYPLSKTLAEEAAWKFSHQNGIDVVTIHPAMVDNLQVRQHANGPCLAIRLSNDPRCASTYQNFAYGWVGVRDVAEAHILAFEEPTANGRYILVERTADLEETGKLLSKLYPGHSLPNKCADENPLSRPYVASKEKAHKLGLKFTPFEEILRETVESLKAHKFLTLDSNP